MERLFVIGLINELVRLELLFVVILLKVIDVVFVIFVEFSIIVVVSERVFVKFENLFILLFFVKKKVLMNNKVLNMLKNK